MPLLKGIHMLVFRHGLSSLIVLDPMGVLYYVPMHEKVKELCEATDAVFAKFDYTLVFGTAYGVFQFMFANGQLVYAYKDAAPIEPIVDFDQKKLVFTKDGVFRGVRP